MRVVIIGASDAGQRLAARLCHEKHDVVLVDHRSLPLQECEHELDVQTVHGSGTSPRVLKEAGVGRSDLVAAVTDRDEVNLVAASFARAAGAPRVAVRVASDELTAPGNVEHLTHLGIDLVINEHDECARELLGVIEVGGAKELVSMVEGRIQAVGVTVPEGSPLLDGPLKAFPEPDVLAAVRLIAVMRGETLLMPHGDISFEPDDMIYCVGTPADVRAFLDVVQPARRPLQKVIVAGGGDLGLRLAGYLERTHRQVILVESDADRASECSAALSKGMVLCGNALDSQILGDIGISPETAIVYATGNDENNIIGCLLAKKLGASFGVAVVSKPEYVTIINEARLLDRAVSPYLTTMNAILRFVRGTSVQAITLLQNVPGELLEIRLAGESKWVDKALKHTRLPRRAVVAAVMRDEVALVPTGETVLHEGDRLIVFAPMGVAARLESIFRS